MYFLRDKMYNSCTNSMHCIFLIALKITSISKALSFVVSIITTKYLEDNFSYNHPTNDNALEIDVTFCAKLNMYCILFVQLTVVHFISLKIHE